MFTTRKKKWSIFKPNLDAVSILYNRLRVDTGSCSLCHSSNCKRGCWGSCWAEDGGGKCQALYCPVVLKVANFPSLSKAEPFCPCYIFCFWKLAMALCKRHCFSPLPAAIQDLQDSLDEFLPGLKRQWVVGWDVTGTHSMVRGVITAQDGRTQLRLQLRMMPGNSSHCRQHLLQKEFS